MELISLYFSKYQNLGLESKKTKEILINILKEIAKVEVEAKQIKIEKNEIKISVTGGAKSQILIYQTKINKEFLKQIEEKGLKPTTKKIT